MSGRLSRLVLEPFFDFIPSENSLFILLCLSLSLQFCLLLCLALCLVIRQPPFQPLSFYIAMILCNVFTHNFECRIDA
jgi:hypothetical protein